MAPKDVLISGSCECVILHIQGTLQMWARLWTMIWRDYPSGSNAIEWILKSTRERQNNWSERGDVGRIKPVIAAFEFGRGIHKPRNEGSFGNLRMALSWQPARKWGPQSYRDTNWIEPATWMIKEKNVSLESPANISLSALWDSEQTLSWACWILLTCGRYETINWCFFSLLNLW